MKNITKKIQENNNTIVENRRCYLCQDVHHVEKKLENGTQEYICPRSGITIWVENTDDEVAIPELFKEEFEGDNNA